VAAADVERLREVAAASPPALPDVTTDAIRAAWQHMTELLCEAGSHAAELCASGEAWSERARAARDAVIRKSIEMRLVATLESD
jgi:hypothetical protein